MKDVLDSISLRDEVTLITLHNIPADAVFLASLFERIAEAGVNVDMISQTAPLGGSVSLSFTIGDAELSTALTTVSRFRAEHPKLRIDASPGNSKITFTGEQMKRLPGVAASVFRRLNEVGVDIRLITTSEDDISVLTDSVFSNRLDDLRRVFGMEPVHD